MVYSPEGSSSVTLSPAPRVTDSSADRELEDLVGVDVSCLLHRDRSGIGVRVGAGHGVAGEDRIGGHSGGGVTRWHRRCR